MAIQEQGRQLNREGGLPDVIPPWRFDATGRVFPIPPATSESIQSGDIGWRQAVVAVAMSAIRPDGSGFVYEDVDQAIPDVFIDTLGENPQHRAIVQKRQQMNVACFTVADKVRRIDIGKPLPRNMALVFSVIRNQEVWENLSLEVFPLVFADVLEGKILLVEAVGDNGFGSIEKDVNEDEEETIRAKYELSGNEIFALGSVLVSIRSHGNLGDADSSLQSISGEQILISVGIAIREEDKRAILREINPVTNEDLETGEKIAAVYLGVREKLLGLIEDRSVFLGYNEKASETLKHFVHLRTVEELEKSLFLLFDIYAKMRFGYGARNYNSWRQTLLGAIPPDL